MEKPATDSYTFEKLRFVGLAIEDRRDRKRTWPVPHLDMGSYTPAMDEPKGEV